MNRIEKKTLLFPRNIFDLTTLPDQPKTVKASLGKFRPGQIACLITIRHTWVHKTSDVQTIFYIHRCLVKNEKTLDP